MLLRDAVASAVRRLAAAGVASPRADALALAAHALGVDRGGAERAMVLGHETPQGFADLVDERCRRVPLQHLTGRAGFRRLELDVGPGVFVPRPETEFVAGIVVAHLTGRPALAFPAGARDPDGLVGVGDLAAAVGHRPLVVDLGTGSGAIALAVKDEVPAARVVAVETSPEALAWARRNVQRLGLDVELVEGDLRDTPPGLDGQVDVVVSNPPYIPDGAVPVDPEVRDHDPQLALYGGGPDGMRMPLAVIQRAADLLTSGGLFVLEHGETQSGFLLETLNRGPWQEPMDLADLAGRPRCLIAKRTPRRVESAEEPYRRL